VVDVVDAVVGAGREGRDPGAVVVGDGLGGNGSPETSPNTIGPAPRSTWTGTRLGWDRRSSLAA
jgi:hypothetical protein